MPRDGSRARARLRTAALALYREQGYQETTAAQIAERAGVTERTFFRHFADKREVLFDGEGELRTILVDAIARAPAELAPLPVLVRAFQASVPMFVANREMAAQREAVIAVTPALQERAQSKLAALVDALVDALVARGVDAGTARLAALVGMAMFDRASRLWREHPDADLDVLLARAAAEVSALGPPT